MLLTLTLETNKIAKLKDQHRQKLLQAPVLYGPALPEIAARHGSCKQELQIVRAPDCKVVEDRTTLDLPSIAQLVERRTVGAYKRISLGRWFKSGSKEGF